jgi:hypothetical protein
VEWDRNGEKIRKAFGSGITWEKWLPADPTSPHWYDEARLGRLIAAHIAHAEDQGLRCPTVREFTCEFRGLSATGKASGICAKVGGGRTSLAEFYDDGANARIGELLSLMKEGSQAIKPRDLGVIGKDHLAANFASVGAAPESFDYRCAAFEHEG